MSNYSYPDATTMRFVPSNTPASGQVTCTGAGTAYQGTAIAGAAWALVAHPDNTDTVWVGNSSGSVSATTGFPLQPGGSPIMVVAANFNTLYFAADVAGEKICYFRLDT